MNLRKLKNNQSYLLLEFINHMKIVIAIVLEKIPKIKLSTLSIFDDKRNYINFIESILWN